MSFIEKINMNKNQQKVVWYTCRLFSKWRLKKVRLQQGHEMGYDVRRIDHSDQFVFVFFR
jgi:hypothetical protein